ncbi:MAG: DUF1640 domain-containing protein [bacterium]
MRAALDTLNIYERLRDAHLDDLAAKEIAEVINEVTKTYLATKGDVEKAKIKLKAEIEKAKVKIIKWVAGMLAAQAAIVATLVKLL